MCESRNPRSALAGRRLPAVWCLLLLLLAGCPWLGSDDNGPSGGPPLAGLKLRLLVVSDPALATAVGQLQGEWAAQTGSDFQVRSVTEEQFGDADLLAADAVICPSHQLGPLAERKLLAPIPKELLEVPESLQGDIADWPDIFEVLRLGEATWGTEVQAAPFGSPVLCCYYRADLLKVLGRGPPQTWAEYQKLAGLLADRTKLGEAAPAADAPWYGTIEPLGPGWAGLVLLARAAPYAKHRENYSTLFEIRTMEPLVAGPPFVRALEELAAAAKVGAPDQLQYDPADARAAFWQGRCGLALTWPTAAWPTAATGDSPPLPSAGHGDAPPNGRARDIRVGFAELPGSTEVYDVLKGSWGRRAEDDDPHVPLLAVAGRIGVVPAKSAHPQAGRQLLFWLSGPQLSRQVSPSSPATTLFRGSHLGTPQTWVEEPISPLAAAGYAALSGKTFSRHQWVFALRIPGRAEYLAALDEAVDGAVRGEQPPGEALRQAAKRWQEITERLGLAQQKAAYRRSLGMEP